MNTPSKTTRLPSTRRLTRAICAASIAAFCAAHAADVTSTWTSATSGVWNLNTNWTNVPALGGFPNNGTGGVATYDAVINALGPAYTVTLNTAITVEDLLLSSANATLNHTTGIFRATGGLTVSAGIYQLNGGEISNTAINVSGGSFAFTSSGGILSNSTVFNGDLNLATNSAQVRLLSGASFTGVANLSASSNRLVIQDTQTLTGKTINLDGSGAQLNIEGTNTLTLGAGTLVRGRGTVVGSQQFVGGTTTLLNAGTIRADLAGQGLTIGGNNFTNQAAGVAEAINGSTLSISATNWSNLGQINATGGSTVNFNNTWNNAGGTATVDATSTLNLAGTSTIASLGTINNSAGGTVNITGTITNTATNLAFNATTGSWRLLGGEISGGQITPGGGGQTLIFTSSAGILSNGAVFNGDLNLATNSAQVRLLSGASFTGVANLSASSNRLVIQDTQTLTGKTINLDGSGAQLNIEGTNTLTLGAGTLVRGRGTVVGSQQFVGGTTTLLNAGTIRADLAGQGLTIGGNNFTNQGTVAATNGSTLSIGATVLTNYNLATQTLTGGTWVAASSTSASVLELNRSGGSIAANLGDITLSGLGSLFRVGTTTTPLENTLVSNGGALRILANRNYTNVNALANSGVLQLGGGVFTAPGLTNTATGEVFGFGTVSIRPTNSGLIRSAGGTLAFANGIQGGGGTVQVDGGSALDLSAGASNSSADLLIHNGTAVGSLNLGANNFTVGVDYRNGSFGTGNTFNPRANVSGSGQILAAGTVAQALTGDVTNGATATPSLVSFGNVHVGGVVTKNYRVANVGTTGPSLRGAIQTSVNGGNLTDPRLSGAGVTAANFGPIAPGTATGNLAVTFNATTGGPLTGQTVRILNNFDNVGDQTLSIAGAAFRFASPSAHSPEPVNFGNRHVGDPFPVQALTLTNTATNDGFSEALDANFGGFTGGVTGSGAVSLLGPGATDSITLKVGFSTATAGSKNGTATLKLTSNGAGSSGLSATALADQVVNVTGAVFRFAAAQVTPAGPVNFGIVHVGDTASRTLTVRNTAVNDGFSEGLNGSIAGTTGTANGAGLFGQLASGADSTALSVNIDTLTAGVKSGTVTLGFVSDGLGTSALGTTSLASQTIDVSAQVNNFAAPIYLFGAGPGALGGGGTSYTLDLGTLVVGGPFAQVTLSLSNGVAAPADSLAGGFVVTPGVFQFSNFSNFTGLLAGQSLSSLTVGFNPNNLGSFTGTIRLDPRSQNASGFDGALLPVTLNITAVVVPEPGAALLLATGGLLVGWRRRRG